MILTLNIQTKGLQIGIHSYQQIFDPVVSVVVGLIESIGLLSVVQEPKASFLMSFQDSIKILLETREKKFKN